MKASETVIEMEAGPDGTFSPTGEVIHQPKRRRRASVSSVAEAPLEPPSFESRVTAGAAPDVLCSLCGAREATHVIKGQLLAIEVKVCAVCAPIAQVGGGLFEELIGSLR